MKNNNCFKFDTANFGELHVVAKNLPNILLNSSKKININSILDKIFVSRPYFAFDKICQFNNILIAPISQEQPIGFESTPISSAEASRHLAILGSCALSVDQEDPKYYLAVKANKMAGIDTINKNIFRGSSQLYVLAMPIFVDDKKAGAVTVLTNLEGDIIFNFMVGYQVFSQELFNRVFKKHYKPTEKINYSPYREAFKFEDIVIKQETLRAILPPMKAEQCAGHFDNFPILPVGILSYMAISVIGDFLKNITNNINLRYYLFNAEMDVIAPTIIDEKSEIIATYSGYKNNQYSFSWIMRSLPLKKVLNTMNISFCVSHEICSIRTKNKIDDLSAKLD